MASSDCSRLSANAKKPEDIGEQLVKHAWLRIVARLCRPHGVDNTVKDRIVKMAVDFILLLLCICFLCICVGLLSPHKQLPPGSMFSDSDCQKQLHEKLRNGTFAIQLNETTTVPAEFVLIVCVQYIVGEDLKQDKSSNNNNNRSGYIYGRGLITLIQQSAL